MRISLQLPAISHTHNILFSINNYSFIFNIGGTLNFQPKKTLQKLRYKWMLTQEGYVEPTDIVSMALVNLSLNSCGDVEPRLYMVETDDRVREALEKRFAGVGPAVDQLSKEWFERKELWQEEEFDLAANQRDRDDKKGVLDRKAAFSEWKTDIHMKEDIFSQYLEQQQRELNEDKGSKWWQFKNFMFHRWGGTGPLTRDAFNK